MKVELYLNDDHMSFAIFDCDDFPRIGETIDYTPPDGNVSWYVDRGEYEIVKIGHIVTSNGNVVHCNHELKVYVKSLEKNIDTTVRE